MRKTPSLAGWRGKGGVRFRFILKRVLRVSTSASHRHRVLCGLSLIAIMLVLSGAYPATVAIFGEWKFARLAAGERWIELSLEIRP